MTPNSKMNEGGKKSGSGRGKPEDHEPERKGGRSESQSERSRAAPPGRGGRRGARTVTEAVRRWHWSGATHVSPHNLNPPLVLPPPLALVQLGVQLEIAVVPVGTHYTALYSFAHRASRLAAV